MEDPNELLSQLVGMLKDSDLTDPAIALGLEKVVMLLEGRQELPQDLAAELMEIQDKTERFRMAAQSLGVTDDEGLATLAQTMIQQNLLKSEDVPISSPRPLERPQPASLG